MKARRDAAYDFLYKMEALDRIGEEVGWSYRFISYFLFFFFLALEIVPLILKWTLGKTEYHYYIEARTQINNQKILSWANLYLRWMQEHEADRDALERVPEVTDKIAEVIEDESTPARRLDAELGADPPKEEAGRDPIEGTTPRDDTPAPDGGDRNA